MTARGHLNPDREGAWRDCQTTSSVYQTLREMALTISSSGFPHLQRTQACRSLFGPVDHEELRSDLCREMNTIRRRDTQRWNFNFERDEPLDGQYSWLRVDCFASDIPPAYDGILRLLTLRGAYNLQSQTPRPTHARRIRVIPKPTSANQNLYTTVPTQTSTTTKTQHRAPSERGKENAGGNCKRKLIQDTASGKCL